MDIMSIVMQVVASNPLVQGSLTKIALDVVKSVFKNVDEAKVAEQASGWLNPTLAVLTAIVAVVTAFKTGNLHNLPLDAFVNWVMMMIAANGTGTKTITQTVNSAVNLVVKK